MKKKLICVFVLCCCLLIQANAQNIALSVDKNCRSVISLNDKNLLNQHVYDLPVTKGQRVQFSLSNPFKKKIIMNIKGAGEHTKLAILGMQKLFDNTNDITTDNKLNLIINNKSNSLNESFTLAIGCEDGSGTPAEVTFQPTTTVQNQNPGGNAGGQQVIILDPSMLNKNAATNNETKQVYKPGSAVYDALKLADNDNLYEDEYKKIIKFYFPNETISDPSEATAAAQKNPFLKMVITDKYNVKKREELDAEAGQELLSDLSLSSIGGLDVTNLVDGLAKFIVKRTKEELSIAFFRRFKNTIDSIPDLQTLFPATTNLLSSIDNDVYDYKKYIQNLRESFKTDINTLDENLPGIIDNHPALFEKYPALEVSLRSGCYITGELKKQVHPGDILANYPLEFVNRDGISRNWPGAIQTIQLLSSSLRDTASTDNNYWVSIKYMRQLVNDKRTLQLYFGLLYQKALNDFDSVHFEKTTLITLLDELAVQYNKYNQYYTAYKLYIMRFAEKTDALNKMIKDYTKPANDSLALELYKKYFDASVDLIEYATQIGKLPVIDKVHGLKDLPDTLAFYFKITQAVSDLAIDINRKNYSSAINHVVYIYDEIATKRSDKPNAKAHLNRLVKYGGFMATVSTAKNSNEVEAAIESFALPTGSASIKRQSPFNVSLNAYAGIFTGFEKIKGIDDNFKVNAYGITAPVGIAISKGHSIFFAPVKWGCSSSIFISLIDIGAVAAYRFKDDTTVSKLPTIQLKDIVSPGIFYSFGFGKTPLSLNIGWQAGPVLRKVSLKENEYGKAYSRFSISLCVDIPVLNFYTKSE